MKINYKILIVAAFVFLASLGFTNNSQAGDCVTTISFDVRPNPAPFNQDISFVGNFSLGNSQLEPPGTANAGYCLKDGQAVKKVRVSIESNQLGNIDAGFIDIPAGARGPWSFPLKTIKPSDKGLKEGQTLNIRAVIYTDFGRQIATSSTVGVRLSAGIYGAFACVADDGKFACSPGNLSDCSDTNACAGLRCFSLSDKNKCGQPGEEPAATQLPATQRPGTGGGTTPGRSTTFDLPNPVGIDTFEELVGIIGKWIFNLSIPIAVIMIIYAGIRMLTAGANPGNFKKGADILKYAVIGLAIVFIGKGFVTLIQSILNLKN